METWVFCLQLCLTASLGVQFQELYWLIWKQALSETSSMCTDLVYITQTSAVQQQHHTAPLRH